MNIRIPWIWITVGLFFGIEIALLWLYQRQESRNRETILFGATIVAGAFALYSYLHRIQEHRFSEAGKMMERWNAPSRVKIRELMANVTDGIFDLNSIKRTTARHEFKAADHTCRVLILSALNFYEELAIGIFEKSIDNDRSRRFFFSIVGQTCDSLSSWIENERNVDRNHTYYKEFEKLVKMWREEKRR